MTAEDFTWQDFARARADAQRQRIERQGGRPSGWPGQVAPAFLEPMAPVTMPAGTWFLPRPASESATRWHLFTGDLAWRPGWCAVKLRTACDWAESLTLGGVWADAPGDPGPCRRCLAAAARSAVR